MTDTSRLAAALSDRYTIERELGVGGMAKVYLAHDIKHDRDVAIKVLKPELAAVLGAERFLAEIKTTANLQHPHILPLFDSGEADSFLFYVMPYVEGISLRDRMAREKQLPINEAIRIATEVAGALDYAHRHGVIHRDIKPENIMLHDGSALVADFGIALAASKAGTRMTETGMSLGTPQYMSPEQAMGERELDARSDVYALGGVTYEMLTGEPPFSGPTAQAIVAKVMTEKPASIISRRDRVPEHVEDAVLTALQKLPADRFATAAEFAAALANPSFAAATPRVATSPAAVSRRWWLRAAWLLSGLFALVALYAWLRPASVSAPSRQHVVLWQHSPSQTLLSAGVKREVIQAAIAPDGSSIVFVDSVRGSLQLMRKLRNESDPVPLNGTEGAIFPFFSPDGRWIGYSTIDGKLKKVSVDGGGSITLADDLNKSYTKATWLDNGTIVYVGAQLDLRRVGAEGGTSKAVIADSTRRRVNMNTVAITQLPGSRGFLYTTCPGNCSIESAVYVFDFSADSGRLLVPNALGAWYSPTGHLLYTDRAGGLYAAAFDLGRMRLTSGAVSVIENVVPGSFVLSNNGSVLYSVTAGDRSLAQLMWVSRDGSAVPVDSTWRADFQYPGLSPDGTTLAVSLPDGAINLWIRRADGARQKITHDGVVNWRPAWTPDGRSIAFSSNRAGGRGRDDYDIYLVPADGSAPPRLLQHHRYGLWEGEFSPDGEWLVVRSDEGVGIGNILARRLRGDTTLVLLVSTSAQKNQISISPDGHWLAYVSDVSGQNEVYFTEFPAPRTTRLISQDGGTEPRWAHSGRELFFKSGGKLMSAAVTPGATLTLGPISPLFSLTGYRSARYRQQYDVARDDRRFVMIHELAGSSPDEVVYAERWFEALKAKVKR